VTDREQNIVADERGAKRSRNLSRHPSAEAAPPKKVKEENGAAAVKEELEAQLQKRVVEKDYIGAAAVQEKLAELRRAQDQLKKCLEDEDYMGAAASKEYIAALMTRGAAAKRVEKEDEEEEKRQAELRRAQDQLKKCLEDEDYTGAAAAKQNIAALRSAGPCSQPNHGRSSAVTAAGHGSQPATGPAVTPGRGAAKKRVEKEDEEEEEKRQAELRTARDQLKKCLEDEDYTGAAAVKENIAALPSSGPCSQGNHGRSKADWSAVTAAGHGSQPATCPTVASATVARGAAAKRVEKEDEEEEKRQAELRTARDQLKKCLEDEDYTGAAAVKENIAALMSTGPCSQGNQAELRTPWPG
jgi:protein-arginine kinase activator protein McsA